MSTEYYFVLHSLTFTLLLARVLHIEYYGFDSGIL